jgi:hypothetical protein
VLIFAAPLACLGLSRRRWTLFAAGGIPGAAILAWYNLRAYGTVLTTGYGDLGDLFGPEHVLPTLRHYAAWLPVVLSPLVVFALGIPLLLRRLALPALVLLLWAVPSLVFYATYEFTNDAWWFLRFLMPIFPPLIVGALLVLSQLIELPSVARVRARSRVLRAALWLGAPLLAAAVAVHSARWNREFAVLNANSRSGVYVEAANWVNARLPPTAAIVAMQASGALFYYTDFPILRWDWLSESMIAELDANARKGGERLYAVLFPIDIDMGALQRLPGAWTQIGTVREVTIWQFTPR